MLSFESVKQRLSREAPFSFLEFNYMILQAYDFLELYRRHNAILQLVPEAAANPTSLAHVPRIPRVAQGKL